ncbi:MAG: periplasmic heavy metal sensor [Alphaproteobacteria bacterium]
MKKLLVATAITLSLLAIHAGSVQAKPHEGLGFVGKALEKLPEAKAKEFAETLKKSHEKDREAAQKMPALMKAIDDALVAPIFDKTAYIQKNEELQKAQQQLRANSVEAFAEAASNLSLEERKLLLEGLHQGPGRPPAGKPPVKGAQAPEAKPSGEVFGDAPPPPAKQ